MFYLYNMRVKSILIPILTVFVWILVLLLNSGLHPLSWTVYIK